MKTLLATQVLFSLLAASLCASPQKQADAFYERGLAAEKRGDLIAADHLYTLAARAIPGHTGAQAKLKEIEAREEPVTKLMAEKMTIENLSVYISHRHPRSYIDRQLNEFIGEISFQSGIPVALEHFDGDLRLNLSNTTFLAVLDEIEKQTGLVRRYERHAVILSPVEVPLADVGLVTHQNKVRISEGVVRQVEIGTDRGSWVRIWFEGSHFYLFCRPENLRGTFSGAIPADTIKAGQRVKFIGKIQRHESRPWVELLTNDQWEILETPSEPESVLPNPPEEDEIAPVDPFGSRLTLWKNKDGKSVEGEFVGLDGEAVVIKREGKEFTILFTQLDTASVEQAKRMANPVAPVAPREPVVDPLVPPAFPTPKHQWSFNGDLKDSLGGAHGTLVDPGQPTARFEDGKLDLSANRGEPSRAQTNDAYVDLPNGLVKGTGGKVTFEIWVQPTQNRVRACVFRFEEAAVEGLGAHGVGAQTMPHEDYKSIFLIPRDEDGDLLAKMVRGNRIQDADSGADLVGDGERHFVLTLDPDDYSVGQNGTKRLYLDGKLVATGRLFPEFLATFNDNNCWLGRAIAGNPFFSGIYNEFRIYDKALTPEEVLASHQAGPDFVFDIPVWKSKDGTSTKGRFVRIDGEAVVINSEGNEITIPFSKLDDESVSQAKRIIEPLTKPEQSPKGITVLKALYGSREQFDSGKERDVTRKAQQLVVDGKLYIEHTRQVFGDPHPYKGKILKITYLVDGMNAPSGKPYEFVRAAGEIILDPAAVPIPPRR